MGFFSYERPGQSRLDQTTARYSAPTFSPGTNIGQFQPRQFPEVGRPEQFIGDMGQHVVNAATLPGQVYEQPFSWVNAATQNSEGKGWIDNVAEGIRSIPIIGEHLSNAGNILNLSYGTITAHDAYVWKNIYGKADDEEFRPSFLDIDNLITGMNPASNYNATADWKVSSQRERLMKLGWTDEDAQAMLAGEKSYWDFGDRQIDTDPLFDLGAKMVLDPLNLILGTGVITKGTRGAQALLRLKASGRAATALRTEQEALSVWQGVKAIAEGSWEGVTTHSLTAFTNGWVRGSTPVFKAYRNGSLGLYAANHGVNMTAQLIPDDWAGNPALEPILDYFKRLEADRPLSENMLYSLFSVMNFPARSIIKDAYTKARSGKVAVMRNDHVLRGWQKLGGGDIKAGKARWLASGRTEEEFSDLMFQSSKLAIARKAWKQGVTWVPKALETFNGNSLAQLGHHFDHLNKYLGRLMTRTMDEASITGDEIVDAMEYMFTNRGTIVKDVASGVERQVFDADQFIRNWNEWEPLAKHLSNVFGDGNVIVPGVSDEVLTTSQVDWMLAMLKSAAKGGDTVAAKDASEILMHAPAVFGMDSNGTFARTLTRSAGDQEVKAIADKLTELRQKAWDPSEWLADGIQYEESAGRSMGRAAGVNKHISDTGKPPDDVNPDYGRAALILPTAEFQRGTHNLQAPIDSVEQLQQLRAREGVVATEFNVPQALAEGGYQIDSAVRVGLIDGQVLQTGIVMKLPDATDFETLAEVAAHGLRETGGAKATVVLTGDTLATHGVAPNAIDFRWEPGKMAPEQADKTIRILRRHFGDRVMFNDSTGTIRILVRDTDTAAQKNIQAKLAKVNKAIGSEPAQQPAFLQDIVKNARKTDVPGTRTVKSVEDIAAPRYHRWHLTKSRLDARRGNVPGDAGATGGGAGGAGPSGATPEEVLRRGVAADDISGERQATRYERSAGRGPGESTDQYLLDAERADQYDFRVNDAVTGNARGGAVVVPDDAAKYITPDGHSGAYVTSSGRAHFWHKPRTAYDAGFDDLVADASNAATWTVVPDISGPGGRTLINKLGNHGWRVVSKSDDELVYLVRDPSGMTGAMAIPAQANGWAAIKNDVPRWTDAQSMATVRAYRSQYLGELRPQGVASGTYRGQAPSARASQDLATRGYAPRNPDEVAGPWDKVTNENKFFAQVDYPSTGGQQSSKIHVTATVASAPRVLEIVSNIADDLGITYKWVKRTNDMAPGTHGFGKGAGTQEGKFITLYVDDAVAKEAAQRIDDALMAEVRAGRIDVTDLPVVPNEIRYAPDSLLFHRYEGNAGRGAAGGGYPAGADIIGTRPRVDAQGRPTVRVDGEDVSVNAHEDSYLGSLGETPEFTQAQTDGIMRKLERITELRQSIAQREATLRNPSRSPVVRREKAELMELESGLRDAEYGITAAVDNAHPGRNYTTLNDAQVMNDVDAVTWLWDADEEIAKFKPNFDPSVSENLDPAELAKIFALEAEIKRWNPQYVLKLAPQNATPYFTGQGTAYRAMMAGRKMAEDDWSYWVTSKLGRAKDLLLAPGYSRDLQNAARQSMYDEWLNLGAGQEDVNLFMRALKNEWESLKVPRAGAHIFRSPDKLLPSSIEKIAREGGSIGGRKAFKGFKPEVLAAVKAKGDSATEIVRRSGSRTYRDLSKRFPAKDGRGSLGGLIDQMYGKDRTGAQAAYGLARGGAYLLGTGYHVFRFLADARWYLMNAFEADVLGFARAGLKATRIGGARKVDKVTGQFTHETKAMRLHQNRFSDDFVGVEDILSSDAQASGWLDPRKLGGYVGAAFDAQRPQTTVDVITRMIDNGDPVIDDLIRKFGGNSDDWVKGLDDLLYDIDTKGAKATVVDEVAEMTKRQELVWGSGGEPAAWTDFLDGLYKAHQKNFQDIMHVFHGNVNRSNLERLLNSPLLWWPLSYQLKAGKWVLDILTDRALGAQTDLLGTWTLAKALNLHYDKYEEDADYRSVWDDHPAMWRTLAMMLPMTPFDMGVSQARWTRYSQSWIGTQLGLWEEDRGYPQDPVDFITRSLQMGPQFTIDLLGDIAEEWNQ